MDGQIYDNKGNLFHPSKDQARLYKAGWRIHLRTKRGMMRIIQWIDPVDGQVYPQGVAITMAKQREQANAKRQ